MRALKPIRHLSGSFPTFRGRGGFRKAAVQNFDKSTFEMILKLFVLLFQPPGNCNSITRDNYANSFHLEKWKNEKLVEFNAVKNALPRRFGR